MAASTEILAPGVYLEEAPRRPTPALETGVPLFLGQLSVLGGALAPFEGGGSVVPLDRAAWNALEIRSAASAEVADLRFTGAARGTAWAEGYLGFAVRGFFENGGRRCYIAAPPAPLAGAFEALDAVEDFDLVCAPDLPATAGGLLAALVGFFEQRPPRRFFVLHAPGDALTAAALDAPFRSECAALYAPWVRVRGCPICKGSGRIEAWACNGCAGTGDGFVPPAGHVAGVYARTDRRVGAHKAPANEVVEGVLDLAAHLDDAALVELKGKGVNALRALPGRGVRVWGARTLASSDQLALHGSSFAHVNARRVLITVARWLEQTMAAVAFEPNDLRLWARIGRETSAFLEALHRRGALAGATADEAFYVRCDAETNPAATRDQGMVVTEVGLSLARPSEFVVVRLVSGAAGASIAGAPAGR
ncbi:phage tail sheath subtilisin-like domain-containing protein [Sorangium sp. So ce375]|uniref:phage tail sheath family protein n=1 Tax=Sorangium sp. So ce375 TaxID=3133306 RepID=UPI003F5C18FA